MLPNQQNGMDPQDQRNFIIAMALMIVFVFGYQFFILEPQAKRANEAREAAQAEAGLETPVEAATPEPLEEVIKSVDEALVETARVGFDADRVDGSINLSGAVIDDLNLKDHYRTVERTEELRLLRPANAPSGYTVGWNWFDGRDPVAGYRDNWTATEESFGDDNLTTLSLEKDGLRFERTISVDENYMFTFEDSVTNLGAETRTLIPIGTVRRYGGWKEFVDATDPGSSRKTGFAHQGLMGSFDSALTWRNYNNLFKGRGIKKSEDGIRVAETGGWLGLTDMYWMAALIPQQGEGFRARVRNLENHLEVLVQGASVELAPGATETVANQIFAGAKEYDVVNTYQEAGIPRFGDAIDWGNILYYLTKGLFFVLNWLQGIVGSFGWAIIALVVLVKLPLVPLYNQSYKSMAKMKKLAEPMKEISERFKADPQRRQQEVMKLYQREKANPLAGCVPILLTIPIFIALYKTLYVTIEMRHTPFGFINDLSAPDPTAIGNLFGLLPWAAADVKAIPILGFVIGIGILPILYGVTMAGIQALSPPPPDPTQRTIMMALPFVFMFVFGGFAAGLVLYWVWSNILSLGQQYFIMRRNGVETQLDKLIKRLLGRGSSTPAE
ncbi:MAG: membrane protein insertase YidC [Pseudomonadota bacterium]